MYLHAHERERPGINHKQRGAGVNEGGVGSTRNQGTAYVQLAIDDQENDTEGLMD